MSIIDVNVTFYGVPLTVVCNYVPSEPEQGCFQSVENAVEGAGSELEILRVYAGERSEVNCIDLLPMLDELFCYRGMQYGFDPVYDTATAELCEVVEAEILRKLQMSGGM